MELEDEVLALLRQEIPECHLGIMMEAAASVSQGEAPEVLNKYKNIPVSFDKFICTPYFVGSHANIYPVIKDNLIALNSGNYVEAVLTGGIGCGKTTIALYTLLYQLYLISCLENPHFEFDLDPTSEIIIVFQSINTKTAKEVGYNRFRAMVEASPYFRQEFMFRKDLESKLVFPNRVEVVPVSGEETAAIGENVVGGLIDELNYMQVVEGSRKSLDGTTYNQAVAVYNSIARRRKTRFMRQGFLPGMLCLVSSKRYPGQFTDKKEQEAKKDPTIFVYDKRVWEIKPEGSYSIITFSLFIGDETRKPRILETEEQVPKKDQPLVIEVPVDFKRDFQDDILNALREVAGVSTLAVHPFMSERERVDKCFGSVKGISSREDVDFVDSKLMLLPNRILYPKEPRWAHIDLGLSSDSAGVSVGFVKGFRKIYRGDHKEILPEIVFDMILEVRPPRGGEIRFWKIRDLLYRLTEIGVPLKWVTYDSWQSVDSIQILRQKGYQTGTLSMDKTSMPYEITKTAFYDGRVEAPTHKKVVRELQGLEQDPATGKIDHSPTGSKDVADSVGGVISGLTLRKEIWVRHGVPLSSVPPSLERAKPVKTEGDGIQEDIERKMPRAG